MNLASVKKARSLQLAYAGHKYIPQPHLFWNHFYTEDTNTRTLLRAFEAIALSKVPEEDKIREELLMLAVTFKHTARFRLRLLTIDLNKTSQALQRAMARICELEDRLKAQESGRSWMGWVIDLFATSLR